MNLKIINKIFPIQNKTKIPKANIQDLNSLLFELQESKKELSYLYAIAKGETKINYYKMKLENIDSQIKNVQKHIEKCSSKP